MGCRTTSLHGLYVYDIKEHKMNFPDANLAWLEKYYDRQAVAGSFFSEFSKKMDELVKDFESDANSLMSEYENDHNLSYDELVDELYECLGAYFNVEIFK